MLVILVQISDALSRYLIELTGHAAALQARLGLLVFPAPEMPYAISPLTTFRNIAWIKGSITFSVLQTPKGTLKLKPSQKVYFTAELMPDILFSVLPISVAGKVQKVMTYGQHEPFFNDPSQKLPLRFDHSNYFIYTCSDEAYGFIKGGMILFHTKLYRLFSSLSPPCG